MTDSVGGAASLIGRRLDHPILGSIIISFLIWNWPLMFAFVGAVTSPEKAIELGAAYLRAASYLRLAIGPLATGLAHAFGAPVLYNWYAHFDERMTRWRRWIAGQSLAKRPVSGAAFDQATTYLKESQERSNKLKVTLQQANEVSQKMDELSNQLKNIMPTFGGAPALTQANELAARIKKLKNILDIANQFGSYDVELTIRTLKNMEETSSW